MDRYGRRAALIAALAAALALPAAATPLTAQRWLAARADPRTLARQPAECLVKTTGDAALSVEIGRAAFRSPTLLGGQAARAGLSCESCHRNGRGNPDFHFPGISGPPGTADVTASLFSKRRGDDAFNPKPIPDLGGPADHLKVARGDAAGRRRFIHGLVVDEFDADEPPAAVLQGLTDYVGALRTCPAPAAPLRAANYASDALRAVRAAQGALAKGDRRTALVMVAAARARLGQIAERYPGKELAPVRARLLTADAALVQVRDDIAAGDTARASQWLSRWLMTSGTWRRPVRVNEPKSLFDGERLAAASRGP